MNRYDMIARRRQLPASTKVEADFLGRMDIVRILENAFGPVNVSFDGVNPQGASVYLDNGLTQSLFNKLIRAVENYKNIPLYERHPPKKSGGAYDTLYKAFYECGDHDALIDIYVLCIGGVGTSVTIVQTMVNKN